MNNHTHGRRLSDDEYEMGIIKIYNELPPDPTREQEEAVRRQELELTIDRRLGVDFPSSRREALWDVQSRVERKHLRFVAQSLVVRLFSEPLAGLAQKLACGLVTEYARVLTRPELEMFFGADEARHPMLPVDANEP